MRQSLSTKVFLLIHSFLDSFRVADNSGATDTTHAKRCSQQLKG